MIRRFIIIVLISLGYIQAAIGLWQAVDFFIHPFRGYIFTGSFNNPGPYACFLAILFPIALSEWLHASNKWMKFYGMGLTLLSIILIPASMSRTAWIACTLGTIIMLYPEIKQKIKGVSKLYATIIILLLTICGCGIYFIKKDSADGRILMWKVAVDAASDAPANGVGWENVSGAYGDAQENYFASGKATVQEQRIADVVEYIFNEYLRVAIAYGIAASVIMTLVIVIALTMTLKNALYEIAGAIAAIMTVMTASYPFNSTLSITIIALVVVCGYMSVHEPLIRAAGTAIVIAGALTLTFSRHEINTHDEFYSGISLKRMGKYRESNRKFFLLLHHSSDPMPLNIIGKNYQALGMPDSAAHYFRRAANRCPNRLYPHYLLMQLYADPSSYDRDLALQEARILATKKEKVPSPAVDEMRRKALAILNANSR